MKDVGCPVSFLKSVEEKPCRRAVSPPGLLSHRCRYSSCMFMPMHELFYSFYFFFFFPSCHQWPSTHRCLSSVVLTFYKCLWTFRLIFFFFKLLSSWFVIGTCLVCFETYLKSKTWIYSLLWQGCFSHYLNNFLLSSRKSLDLQICDKNRIVPDSISPRPKWNTIVLLCVVPTWMQLWSPSLRKDVVAVRQGWKRFCPQRD